MRNNRYFSIWYTATVGSQGCFCVYLLLNAIYGNIAQFLTYMRNYAKKSSAKDISTIIGSVFTL